MASLKSIHPISQYLLYGVLLIGVAGCEGLFNMFDDADKHFPLEDKYKIKFNEGDTLTYTDQSGAIFRLVISEIRYDTHARSRKGSSGPYNIFERQAVYYDSVFTSSASWGGIFTRQPTGYVQWLHRTPIYDVKILNTWHAALAYERAEVEKLLLSRTAILLRHGEFAESVAAIRARCGGAK